MAQELITQYNDFEPSTISYGAPRTNARGGKNIKILNDKKNSLILSTPLILCWGAQKMVDEESGRVNYSLNIQFPNEKYGTEPTLEFFEKMKQFESKVLDDSVQYCKEWFGKQKMSREVAEALFSPMLKYPKDKNTGEIDYTRPPTMRIKIPFWEGKFNVELYDIHKNSIFTPDTELGSTLFESLIPKSSNIIAALQCNGIWFVGGKFGVSWKLVQSIVRPPVRIQGGCFLSVSSSDKKHLNDISKREEEENQKQENNDNDNQETNVNVDDSDDEQDENQENETEPEAEIEEKPKKVVKKKRKVVKKKST